MPMKVKFQARCNISLSITYDAKVIAEMSKSISPLRNILERKIFFLLERAKPKLQNLHLLYFSESQKKTGKHFEH